MKLLFDIGHPAHVHYFKNSIGILTQRGHEIQICARERGEIFELLDSNHLSFFSRGRGGKSLLGKLINIPMADWKIYKRAEDFKPDLLIGFASPYVSHVGWLAGKPSIVFDDTEHARLNHALYRAFATTIMTPSCFLKDFRGKHVRFAGFMELAALHPDYFTPKPDVDQLLGLDPDDKCFVVRFISWDANHDAGLRGLSLEQKIEIISSLESYGKVFISSESKLPEELSKYKLGTAPADIHSVLSRSTIFVSEGATMASEAAMLGIPSIYINPLDAGTLMEQERRGLLFRFKNYEGVQDKIRELAAMPGLKEEWQKRRGEMLSDKIDVTEFIVWFIENYPQSSWIMKSNPDYQSRFKRTLQPSD